MINELFKNRYRIPSARAPWHDYLSDHDGFDLTVYPNPTSNIVNVQCTMNNVQFGEVELQLVDAYGRLLAW